jgi:hypothetical protein
LQEGVGGSFQQYFYNRYKIVVYTGLRSDSIKNHASRNEACRIAAMSIIFTRISCILFTCDMYMCRLRYINDPVLSSLKIEGIRLLFFWPFNGHRAMFSVTYFPVPIGASVWCNTAHLQNPEEIRAPRYFNV